MRDRRPECTQPPLRNGHSLAAQQVRERAVFQKIQFDLVVPIRPPHGCSLPQLAGETVWLEVGTVVIKAMHKLRVQEFSAMKQGGSFCQLHGRIVHA